MILKNLCVAFLIILSFSSYSESLPHNPSTNVGRFFDLSKISNLLNFPSLFKQSISSLSNSKKINGTYFESWPLDYIWAESSLKKQFTRMLITIVIYKKIAIFLALSSLIFWIPVFTSSEGFFPSYAEEKEEESRSYGGKNDQLHENLAYFEERKYDREIDNL
ncbi:hypothetical protein ACKWTF_008101 [Chironomus riparius]